MMIDFHLILIKNDSPENAGAVARLMGNFEISNLIFVDPYWNDFAKAEFIAHTKIGKSILGKAKIFKKFSEVDEKIKFNFKIGFTRRAGKYREISGNYRKYFADFFNSKFLKKIKVALVFGNEEKGLSDEDTAFCSNLLYIPTSNDSPSLNLSHAVSIILNEIFIFNNLKSDKFSDLSLDVEKIFSASNTAERDLFYKEIVDVSKRKKLFIKNDEVTFKRMFERIFSSPVISNKDLELLKRLFLRFIYSDKKGNK